MSAAAGGLVAVAGELVAALGSTPWAAVAALVFAALAHAAHRPY